MGPIFKELKPKYSSKPIRFELLDLTTRKTAVVATKNAKALGIEDIFRYSTATGLYVIIDAVTLEVVDRLDPNMGKEWIGESIDDALKQYEAASPQGA